MAGELEQGVADVVPDFGFLQVPGCFGQPGFQAVVFLFFLGFLLIAFSPDRRALHDRIAGTRVERSP